jgi:hypothetical protein
VTEFKDVVNCCPVKERLAVPVTVTEFKDVFNNCPVTLIKFIISTVVFPSRVRKTYVFSPNQIDPC